MKPSAMPLAGIAIAVWAVLPPYVGPALATDPTVEIVDHVIPAVVVLGIALATLVAGTRAAGTPMFAGGLVIALAGFWMLATHVPLVAQANRGQAPWGATLWHSIPGLVVLAFGLVWALLFGGEAGDKPSDAPSEEPAAGEGLIKRESPEA